MSPHVRRVRSKDCSSASAAVPSSRPTRSSGDGGVRPSSCHAGPAKTAADAAKVAEWGYQAALVGTALMRAEDPDKLIGEMLSAARDRVAA